MPPNPNLDIIATLNRMIAAYEIMDREIYKPLASVVHAHAPEKGITEFNIIGLWFIAEHQTQNNVTIDAKTYMAKARDPMCEDNLYNIILILNSQYSRAMNLDGRFNVHQRQYVLDALPNNHTHMVYNAWDEFDKHMLELTIVRNTLRNALQLDTQQN